MPDTTSLLSHVYVQLDGADAPDDFARCLLDVTVESSLHLADVASVVLHDPKLKWIDDPRITPGKALCVSVKSGRNVQPLFDGEIVEIEPDFRSGTQNLVVRAFNRLHRLARGRHVRSYQNVSDGDIVKKIAAEVQLQAHAGPTSQVHAYALQRNETNLEFLSGRAAALGYHVFVRGGTLHFDNPRPEGQPVPLEWGATMSEFHPRMTTLDQADGVTVRGWDPAAKREIVGQARPGRGGAEVGDTRSGGEVSRACFNLPAQRLVTDVPVRTQAAADRLAQAVADRIAGHFIEAEGVCTGNPAIVAGAAVNVTSVGDRFSGTYFVTAATHVYSAEAGYSTQFSVSGHRPATLLGLLGAASSGAPHERSMTSGLVVGIVTDNKDPEGQGRVKVKYPSLSADHASDWARLVSPGAGPDRGLEFLPEINDEVLVGFELGDIHCPYVLGGLWNGRDAPPKKSDGLISSGKVQQRIIRSRLGHVITLDDSDSGGGISIQDKAGNKIVLDAQSNALTVEVKGNASIKSQGDITVEAQGNLSLKASGQVEIKGMGVKVDGGASSVDVKGSPINLN